MIPVTKPFLPPQDEYINLLNGIWQRQWLTNNGPLVNDLENQLKAYLNLPYMLYMTNGTIAIQIAIKALGLTGEIITTPFSYVATTSSIVWEGCTPVFVDIDPYTFNIDASKIELAITSKTSAILATHVFGNPCDIDAIDSIAKKYNLKVIYDAAHCFGTKYKGKSVFAYGDISTSSFHATKLFHTIEGGAVFANTQEMMKIMGFMRNFGHNGPETFQGLGINGKNSEFHAAMGLINLKYISEILSKRKEIVDYYDSKINFSIFKKPSIQAYTEYNYAYYPILFRSEEHLLDTFSILKQHDIYGRRYFYPSLSELSYVKSSEVPNSMNISNRIACLPLYHSLSFEEIDLIATILNSSNYK